jgi:uncharacterized protein (DUF58 family)
MKTLWRLLRIGFHGTLLFVLPWGVGAIVGMVFDVREVEETANQFASYAALILLPILLLQLAAITVKVAREIRSAKADGRRGGSVVVDALDRHVKVLTTRGIAMAGASLLMVFVALERKFGQFAALAVAGLGLMYIASTAATIVSAFWVRAFDDRVRRTRGAIDREISPTVIDAGDAATERFHLARVPVPPGFRMHLEERLPERLGGDTRFAVDRTVSGSEVTVSAPLPRTPRGLYRLGPAEVWYEDILGLTRVFVAARAVASLRVLPRLRPVVFDRQPKSYTKAEGSLSVLSRIASEEHYRTRPYVAGDDLRRVHWKQSINTGQLVIRVPEAVPYAPSRVRLVLDTFLPPHLRVAADAGGRRVKSGERAVARAPEAMDEVLDLLVEGWIALAHALQKRGEMVTLVLAVRPEPGANAVVRSVDCKRGDERKWRAIGSDAAWAERRPAGSAAPRDDAGQGGEGCEDELDHRLDRSAPRGHERRAGHEPDRPGWRVDGARSTRRRLQCADAPALLRVSGRRRRQPHRLEEDVLAEASEARGHPRRARARVDASGGRGPRARPARHARPSPRNVSRSRGALMATDTRTRVPRWTPPLRMSLRLAWRPALVFNVFSILGWLALISTAVIYENKRDTFEMFVALCTGTVGVLLGQLVSIVRIRLLPIFVVGGAFAFAAFWLITNSAWRHLNIPDAVALGIVFFCFAFPCGLLSLQHRWELFAAFWPSIGWIGAVFNVLNREGLAYDWSQNKLSAWRPLTLAFLFGFLVCLLFYFAAKQAVRVELWQALSGTAARRVEKQAKPKPAVSALPRKNWVPLLVVAILLFVIGAVLQPFLWRTGRGDREIDKRGAPSHEPNDGDEDGRGRGPKFDGEGFMRMMQQMAEAAKKGATHLWPLLFLLLLYRPAKRALLLSHLKTPIFPTPPSERVDNLWEYVRIAAEDAGVKPTPSDSVEQILVRIHASGIRSPAVAQAADIYVRTRYGFTVAPGAPNAMRAHAIAAADDLRKDLTRWQRVKNLWRPLE